MWWIRGNETLKRRSLECLKFDVQPDLEGYPVTSQSTSKDAFDNSRHKTASGLRPPKSSAIEGVIEESEPDIDADARSRPSNIRIESPVRQLCSDTGFPQHKGPIKDAAAPILQPSCIDKFISGMWRQEDSTVTLCVSFPVHFHRA